MAKISELLVCAAAASLIVIWLNAPVHAADARATAADWRSAVRKFAEEHFQHPAWGASHSARDYVLARELAKEDRVSLDDDVLYAASYLHDAAAFAPYEKNGVDHQDEGARIADSLLSTTGFPMKKVDGVRKAIRTHMYERDPETPEALYLHDADALDWLGAIGVARIFSLVDPTGGSPNEHEAAAMLEGYLKDVPARVLSPAGRKRVAYRRDELRAFLRALHEEDAGTH
jgi:HD superfamily phosphodiesterase